MRTLLRFLKPYRLQVAGVLGALALNLLGVLLVPTILANMINIGTGLLKGATSLFTGGLGGIGGGLFGRGAGAILGGINVRKGEANVTLSVVDARTTEEVALVEGYARKTDTSFGAGAGGLFGGGTFAGAAGGGYQDTAVGQIIVLAYLDAYTKLVSQMGGLPTNAAAAAPPAGK